MKPLALRAVSAIIVLLTASRLFVPTSASAIMECMKEDIVADVTIENVKCSGNCNNLKIDTLNTEGIKLDASKMLSSTQEVSNTCSSKSRKMCRTFRIEHDSVCRNNPLGIHTLTFQPGLQPQIHSEQLSVDEIANNTNWRFVSSNKNTTVSFSVVITPKNSQ